MRQKETGKILNVAVSIEIRLVVENATGAKKIWTVFLEDHAATSRAAYARVAFASVLGFGTFGVFFLDHFLRLNGHVDDIGSIVVEFGG